MAYITVFMMNSGASTLKFVSSQLKMYNLAYVFHVFMIL